MAVAATSAGHEGAGPGAAASTRAVHEYNDQWRASFASLIRDEVGAPSRDYHDSAAKLRSVVRTGLLKFTDLRDCPEKFFEAHRLLMPYALDQGPGFFIRFTVQYNLFAGTVLELASPEQLERFQRDQARGELGCFALTERLAGVNSGLVVETTAEWVPARNAFRIHTPHDGACKNWISQGLTAKKAVVMATLTTGGQTVGPHAFLVDLRGADGMPTPGVTLGDMGEKTTGNDLDNAWIRFTDVWVMRDALLDRHCDVTPEGKYASRGGSRLSNMVGRCKQPP